MSTLSDPGLIFAVLRVIATWLTLEQVRHPRHDTAYPAELAELRALSVQDLHKLAAMRPAVAAVQIDPNALRWGLGVLGDARRGVRLRDQFICKGASTVLMRRLFKLDERATRRLRRQFQVPARPGRPRLPDKRVRDAMQALWHGLEEPDPRERYLVLNARFPQWSLDTLHLVIRENRAALAMTRKVGARRDKGVDGQRRSPMRVERRVRSERRP